MKNSRELCPLCETQLIGTLNTRYCRNPKCELYDEPLQGRLLDIIAETRALLDKEMKDHWHKHQIAIQLKEAFDVAYNGLLKIRSCTNHTTPQGTIAFETLCRLGKNPYNPQPKE